MGLLENSAIDRYLMKMFEQMMYAYPEEVLHNVKEYGPDCTEEEVEQSIKRLMDSGFLQFFEEYYALGRLPKSYMRRYCG